MKTMAAQLMFVLLFTLSPISSALSREITLSGLKAKAVFDTLSSHEKLKVFTDAAMGVRLIAMNDVSCLKNTFPGKEIISCTFHDETNHVNLYSDTDQGLEEIRFVLVESSRNESQTTDTLKELFIKKLSCKVSGLGHVLDDNAVELKYSCSLVL